MLPPYVLPADLIIFDAWEEARPDGREDAAQIDAVWTDGSTIFCGTVPLVRDGSLGLDVTLDLTPSTNPSVTRAQQALRYLLNDRCGAWTPYTPTGT
jgi:hypothetical protein